MSADLFSHARSAIENLHPAVKKMASAEVDKFLETATAPLDALLSSYVDAKHTQHVKALQQAARTLAVEMALSPKHEAHFVKQRLAFASLAVEAAIEHDGIVIGAERRATAVAIAKSAGEHLLAIAKAAGPVIVGALL